jgi:hypothetical protein
LSFPLNPTPGQQITKDGVLYQFNPPRGWEIEVSSVPPAPPAASSFRSTDAGNAIVLGTDQKLFVASSASASIDGGSP